MKKKLLVIGAGIGQVNIVKMAKEMGVYVIVVTYAGDWPATKLADETWDIDIYDYEAIIERAKNEKIDAVISDQNDLMMPTVAKVAETLGIPGNTYNQVWSYCNKKNYRKNCERLGIPVPKNMVLHEGDSFEAFDVPLPWIVKPTDSQSSIGVKKIEKLEEAKAAISEAINASKNGEAILEEFFVGKELVCEGFIENGKYYNLAFADRKYFDLKDLMIPTQTLFPSVVDAEIQSKILSYETKMAAEIGPSFAIVHSEYLYNEQTKEIRVVESALRGGGVFISSHLIPFATGIDINRLLLEKALGNNVSVEETMRNKKSAASGYVCFYLKDGIIAQIEGVEELSNFSFVKMVDLHTIQEGQQTEKMLYKGARKGPILVVANSRAELEDNIKKVQSTLVIKVQTKNGIEDGIVWE